MGWYRHFFYRRECVRTTWKFRALLALPLVLLFLTTRLWTTAIGNSLVCEERLDQSEALLLENFDPDYLVFERATALRRSNVAHRILVPVVADGRARDGVNAISQGAAELMARVAHLPAIELIPIVEREPISLNAARQLLAALQQRNVRSMTVVAPGFRSARSRLVYSSVLAPAGIEVRCSPVFGRKSPRNWTDTWHGIQEVSLQFLKLQYYRFWVLPTS